MKQPLLRRKEARMGQASRASADLQSVPGVGPSIARDLADLGIRRVTDLRGRNPEAMYEALCARRGERQDRCLLYVFRCAVYYASRKRHDPELLKWWSWKDAARERGAG